jgi:hypothetical protein
MVEEVIKKSEESDEKYERNSSNETDNNIEYFQSEEEVDHENEQCETNSTSNDCGNDLDEFLITNLYFEVDPSENKNYEIKEEFDFEEQLIYTFDEIKELKKNNALLEELLEE